MSNKLNYTRLMALSPTKYTEMINSDGQLIEFYEHPIHGDSAEVICVCHDLQLASYSGFFDCDDMINLDKEYEPLFIDGQLYIGMNKSE